MIVVRLIHAQASSMLWQFLVYIVIMVATKWTIKKGIAIIQKHPTINIIGTFSFPVTHYAAFAKQSQPGCLFLLSNSYCSIGNFSRLSLSICIASIEAGQPIACMGLGVSRRPYLVNLVQIPAW